MASSQKICCAICCGYGGSVRCLHVCLLKARPVGIRVLSKRPVGCMCLCRPGEKDGFNLEMGPPFSLSLHVHMIKFHLTVGSTNASAVLTIGTYIVPTIHTKHTSHTLIFRIQHTPVILERITHNEVVKIRKGK